MTLSIPPGLGTLVSPEDAFFGAAGEVYRRVDVFNSDGTPYYLDAPILDGSVGVDMNRDERRTFELTFDSPNNEFRSDSTGFWYDKIIRIYRGVQDASGAARYYPLGVFMIDTITEPHAPHTVAVAGRDLTKQMMLSKFATATAFGAGVTLESVVNALAGVAGITNRNIPVTGVTLDREFFFEVGKSRWESAVELVTAYGYELFFDQYGFLIMRLFVDPTTAPVSFSFLTGGEGNLVGFSLVTNDSRIYNHVVVSGGASNSLPVDGEAENTEESSPTRIARLGRRTYSYESKFVESDAQCAALAMSLLKIMALESYELAMEALVAPWLEAGTAVEFLDPDPAPLAPTRFLLTDFSIPLTVGTMTANAKRVTLVF